MPYDAKLMRATGGAERETHWHSRRQNVEEHVAARAAGSRAACGGGKRARQRESTYAQLVDMMSMIVTHNRLRDGSLEIWVENATCAQRMDRAKLNSWRVNLASSGGSARFLAFTR